MSGEFEMHIYQKPKDLLPNVNVPSKILTILSNNKAKTKTKNKQYFEFDRSIPTPNSTLLG